jgi:hypothetical protein
VLEHSTRFRLPHLDHRWWPFGSRRWPSERFYVSLLTLSFAAPKSDGLGSYESHGSVHKQLTFSEFLGESYDAEVSRKFVEYLMLCFRTSPSHSRRRQLLTLTSAAKAERELYTLKQVAATMAMPPVPYALIEPPSNPPPVPRAAGPVRTQRKSTQARMKTGPMTPALKARIMANMATGTGASKANSTRADETQVAALPTEANSVKAAESAQPIPFCSQMLEDDPDDDFSYIPVIPDMPNGSYSTFSDASDGLSYSSMFSASSDSLSYASTVPDDLDFVDVEMDGPEHLTAGPWTVIDHFTGEVIVDEDFPPATPGAPFESEIQVEVIPALGTSILIQTTPPALLFEDQDERPNWLIRSTNEFLQHAPYYMCLNKVIDLFFAQEADLGYPDKVSNPYFLFCPRSLTTDHQPPQSTRLPLPSKNRPNEIAVFMKNARDFTRGDNLDAEKFGRKVINWWVTIQPTMRKAWPPNYGTLPDDFSFAYFKHGGPNGVFLMVLCLCWWANALSPDADHTNFKLVVHDVRWVLEQIASRV